MTFERALRNAIEAERAAARFYQLLLESTEDPEARKFLKKMMDDENAHARAIEDLGRKLAKNELPLRPDDNCELVETSTEWADVDDIVYEEALKVALDAEVSASLYYSAMADLFEEERYRTFFRDLSNAEDGHRRNIELLQGKTSDAG
jgi:rubrerythrin